MPLESWLARPQSFGNCEFLMLPQPQTYPSFDPVSHDLMSAAVQRQCEVLDSSTEVHLPLPLPETATTHLRSFHTTTTDAETTTGYDKRDREFKVGRFCAQHALKQLSIDATVPVDTDRKPIWPTGIIGSISHSENFAWAATLKQDTFRGIGIDTEIVVDDSTLRQVIDEITAADERDLFSEIHDDFKTAFTIVFSAKESIYKCLYPNNEQFFGFHDVKLIAATDATVTFTQQPSNPNFSSAPRDLTVHLAVAGRDVFTSIWI